MHLLGTIEIFAGGRVITNLPKAAVALLTLLALRHQDSGIERTTLATILWPDADLSRALFYLRRALFTLRAALDDDATRLRTPTPSRLALDLSHAFFDVRTFDAGAVSAVDSQRVEMLALYRGPLLEGWTEPWVLHERDSRTRRYVDLLEAQAESEVKQEDLRSAARHLRTALTVEPLRESVHMRLIEILVCLGDHVGAEWQFNNLRRLLREEVNCVPSPATLETYRRLRSRSGTARRFPPLPPTQPPYETISTAPPPPPPTAHISLPCPLTTLIGRSRDIHDIAEAVDRHRVVTLTGPGGVGKTRLAIAVAEDRTIIYREGVWFIDLASVSSSEHLARHISGAIGLLGGDSEATAAESLCDFLRDKRFLMVLDNAEVVTKACQRLVEQILGACPFVHVLLTSHHAVQAAGERVMSVAPLTLPPCLESLSSARLTSEEMRELSRYEAVALLLDRASARGQSFRLTAQNAEAVTELCRRLDGLPLALEIAAAQLRRLSPQQVLNRLDATFATLTLPRHERATRHRSLNAMIGGAYHLLEPAERRLLARLSVFQGGWTIDMAEAVCSDNETDSALSVRKEIVKAAHVQEHLAALVAKSLVTYAEDGRGQERYRLLETIRVYAAKQLEADERSRCTDRMTGYFIALLDKARSRWVGAESAYWMNRFTVELPNLRTALRSSTVPLGKGETEDTPEVMARRENGLTLATRLMRFWHVRGHIAEGRQWIMFTLAVCRDGESVNPESAALAFNAAGALSTYLEDYDGAVTYHQRALEIRRAAGDKRGTAVSLHNLGLVYHRHEAFAEAQEVLEGVWELYRELGNRSGEVNALYFLGTIALDRGEIDKAERLLEQTIEYRKEQGDPLGLTMTYNNLGRLALLRHQPEKARFYFRYCLETKTVLGNTPGILDTLDNVVALLDQETQTEDFLRLSGAIAALRERLHLPRPKLDRERSAERIEAVRALIGGEGSPLAWKEGSVMSLTAATDYALRFCKASELPSPYCQGSAVP